MGRSSHKINFFYIFTLITLLFIAAFNVFYKLDDFSIYSWDEARHGVTAYEMIKNNNFIVNTYRNKVDYWNLKPPLSFWTIVLGYKIAGSNALGLRLFSAVFSILTITLVSIFVNKNYGKLASTVSALVLSTCTQFLINHSSRTGDADSLFVFLFTIAILSLLQWDTNNKWLYVSGLSFSFAFLTKSWHSGNIAIIMGLYLCLTGKYKKLSSKNWIILCMCMLLPILIWAGIRYQYDGLEFFRKMIMYDLLQRSTAPIERHFGGVFYYLAILYRFFALWILFLCLTSLLLFLKRGFLIKTLISIKNNPFIIGNVLWVLIPFILFTIAKTKIRWYILPIYPPLSIIIGVLTSKILMKSKWLTRVLLIILIVSVSIFYEVKINTYLNNSKPKLKQCLIEKISNDKNMKGNSLFIYHLVGNQIWLQSETLAAELSNDLQVKEGNFTDFLKTNKALLLIPSNLYSEQLIKSYKLKVIAINSWGYLVEKQR
jgi:4-amino-4-deoxy-L-arabinose transferase-like glycosyltransferase